MKASGRLGPVSLSHGIALCQLHVAAWTSSVPGDGVQEQTTEESQEGGV